MPREMLADTNAASCRWFPMKTFTQNEPLTDAELERLGGFLICFLRWGFGFLLPSLCREFPRNRCRDKTGQLSLCRLFKIRYLVDSIPSALTT